MRIEEQYDFKNPNIVEIFKQRTNRLIKLRNNPEILPNLKTYYKQHPAQFIIDWGCTADYEAATDTRPAIIPFILFPKQVEWVLWLLDKWQTNENGLVEKTRQMGMSWLSVATACTLCLFNDDIKIGFGSRKEEYVDKHGDTKSLFEKARIFMNLLPNEFTNNWDDKKHSKHMQIKFPTTNSAMIGECGDGIGRGDNTSLYFVDEAAFLERSYKTEASLSQGTRCRIDISTPNGVANAFYEKRQSGRVDVFTFNWRDDPRKDDVWYEKQKRQLDPVALAQEVDISYSASVAGIVIPAIWIQSSIDAHLKLGIVPTGLRIAALDVADEGSDLNALCSRHGIIINFLDQWSGKDSDIGYTTQKAIGICDELELKKFFYDADGLGAGVKGYVRIANEVRPHNPIQSMPFRGGASVYNPESKEFGDRLNKDYFVNLKAQCWWQLRKKFENTYNAVNKNEAYNPDELISIPSNLQHYQKLINELSQPTYSLNSVGKILIDKKPQGTKSPNLADAAMMCYSKLNSQNNYLYEELIF